MKWIVGPLFQEANSTFTWTMSGFNVEPGGVVVTAEALGFGTTVTSTNSGSHQPNFAEAQLSRDDYKLYQLDVTNPKLSGNASFWILGIS
jgi:hypothetical protein